MDYYLAMRSVQADGEPAVRRTFIEAARRAQIIAAAVEVIAEVGYAQASLARIAERIGVSKGVISYHFAGKEDLVREVIADVLAKAVAYLQPRVEAEPTGAGKLRAVIESNLAFMDEHREQMIAFYEIAVSTRGAGGSQSPAVAQILHDGVSALRQLLAAYQAAGEFRPDFDPEVMAAAIRAAIDAVPPRLARNPDFDVRHYGRELADLFGIATRAGESLPGPGRR
jgi:AcrR family transcriptional regulator